MQRISTSTAVANLFGAGKSGFGDGDPTNGTAATALNAAWFNTHQEELAGVVEAFGLALDPNNNGQVLAAIKGFLQQQLENYAADTGVANAYAVALNPALTQHVAGMRVWVKIGHSNTGASTIDTGFGPVNITHADGSQLNAGELLAGSTVCLIDTGAAYMFHPTRGRLIGIQIFAAPGSSIYNPTPGTQFVIAEGLGGGAAGGGAPATGASQVSMGGGGGAGAWGRKKITAGFAGVTITVGAAGVGVAGSTGGNGSTSSFGAFLSCPGGRGAGALGPISQSSLQIISGGINSSAPSGADIGNAGASGHYGINTTLSLIGGVGASTRYGGGGAPSGTTGSGTPGSGFGAGGGGASAQPSQGAQAGADGAPGLFIVEEYA